MRCSSVSNSCRWHNWQTLSSPWEVVVFCLTLESIGAHPKLTNGDPKCMHLVSPCILRLDDKAISQLVKVVSII